jgi:hypothetical protein
VRTTTKLILAAGGAAATAALAARQWWRTWGREPDIETASLPGDDLVGEPTGIDTRAIEIDAPPEAVWPWLVQMGYGRAGWYSYDALDMRGSSAEAIVDDLQELAVGDVVPTHPEGGFEVAVLDPGRALVLRTDTALMARQAEAAVAAGKAAEPVPTGLAASEAFLAQTPPEFAASWAFVLEPLEGGRTRLIERFSVWFGEPMPGFAVGGLLLGFGVFVMTQRQMVGLKRRAERAAGSAPGGAAATATVVPASASA